MQCQSCGATNANRDPETAATEVRAKKFDRGDPHGECTAEIHRLQAELSAIASALPGTLYMDPPDGGSVTIAEQVARLVKDRDEANTLVFKLTKRGFLRRSGGMIGSASC